MNGRAILLRATAADAPDAASEWAGADPRQALNRIERGPESARAAAPIVPEGDRRGASLTGRVRGTGPVGGIERRAVLRFGVSASLGALGLVTAVEESWARTKRGFFQSGWRYCSRCQGLWYSGGVAGEGVCPEGGNHSRTGDYAVRFGGRVPGEQRNWGYCTKCAALWYAVSTGTISHCPKDGSEHGLADTGAQYTLRLGSKPRGGYEPGWRRCAKCKVLWSSGYDSLCPAGGLHGATAGAGYSVRLTLP